VRLCLNSHTTTKRHQFVAFRTDGPEQTVQPCRRFLLDLGSLAKMERSLITDMPREKYVERCKRRAFDYLDQGDLRKAAALFVTDMNARPDCELPHHLAMLSVSLLMAGDALGWRALIEGLR
jgi:hypothetical protein